jgi:hypothetical protein
MNPWLYIAKKRKEEMVKKTENKWIPCEDQLPTENGNYLIQVISSDGTADIVFMMVDHCNEDGTWLHCDGKKRKVVAWMPLPQPYEMVGEIDIFERYGLSPLDVSEMKSAMRDPIASQNIWRCLKRKGLSYEQANEVVKALNTLANHLGVVL